VSIVLIPGSFDPLTLGHIEIVKRCSLIFDQVVVLVGFNEQKKGFLEPCKRVEFARDAFKSMPNVTVDMDSGLIVDYAHENNIDIIVKGIRNEEDLAYESEMAYVNNDISFDKYGKVIETLFMNTHPEYYHYSSSLVRKLLALGLPVGKYIHNEHLLFKLINE